MQESRRSAVDRSLPGSIFDKFEHIYNEEDMQLKQNDKARKVLLAQIMDRQQRINSQKKEMQRQFTERENKEIDLFWKNQEERLRAIERKRKEEIDEARRVNSSNFNQLLSKSMHVDSYHLQKSFRDDLAAFQEKERLKKQNAQKFYQQGMIAEQARLEKKQYDRELDLIIAQQKQKEDRELSARREQYFNNWRSKHFEEKHPNTVKLVSQLNQKNEIEKAQLEEMIAVRGGQELNQRVAVLRGQELEEKQAKKEDYTRQIKNQIEENTYKAAIDRYLELNYERKRMAEMGKMLEERDMKEKQQKKEVNTEHLTVLKNQFKPRVLLQEPDKIEHAGIGSPAHIGKIVHDDRIKQLKYIERSYLHELNHL